MEKERTMVHDHGNAQPQIGRSVYEMCTCYLTREKKIMEKMGVFGCESGNVKFP